MFLTQGVNAGADAYTILLGDLEKRLNRFREAQERVESCFEDDEAGISADADQAEAY